MTVEGEVVAKQDAAPLDGAQQRQQMRHAGDVLAVDFDQHDRLLGVLVDLGVDRLDEGAFAHAPRAPQKGAVGRQAVGEPFGVFEQDIALAVDPLEEGEIHPVDLGDPVQALVLGLPDEGLRRRKIEAVGLGRRQTVEGLGDASQERLIGRIGHGSLA